MVLREETGVYLEQERMFEMSQRHLESWLLVVLEEEWFGVVDWRYL